MEQTMGARIAALRKEKGMTQLELAQRMNVTDKAVSKWERDKAAPDIRSVPGLAELLGITADALLAATLAHLQPVLQLVHEPPRRLHRAPLHFLVHRQRYTQLARHVVLR